MTSQQPGPAGASTSEVTVLREPTPTTRGSGPVTCCGYHRARCLFGRPHTWTTWYQDAKLQRTRDTYHCHQCSGVCIAEEELTAPALAAHLGAMHGAAGLRPYGQLDNGGDALLLTALGEIEPTTQANHLGRLALIAVYQDAHDTASTMLAALYDAAAGNRDRAAYCPDCRSHPAALCDDDADRLTRADEYDRLAAQRRGNPKLATGEPGIMLLGIMLAALYDAAAGNRDRAAYCPDCRSHPAGLCDDDADRLTRADEYDRLAAQLPARWGPAGPLAGLTCARDARLRS